MDPGYIWVVALAAWCMAWVSIAVLLRFHCSWSKAAAPAFLIPPIVGGVLITFWSPSDTNGIATTATYLLIYASFLLPSFVVFSAVAATSPTVLVLQAASRDGGTRLSELKRTILELELQAERESELQDSVLVRSTSNGAGPSWLGVLLLSLTGLAEALVGGRRSLP